MVFNFLPYASLGGLKFSMDRADVRKLLGTPNKEFMKTAFSKNTTDGYLGFHIYYDTGNKVEAIEFTDDSSNNVVFQEVNLLTQSFQESVNFLSATDDELKIENDGLVSSNLGLAIYAPEHTLNPEAKIESLLLYRKGYFE
ncbi:hypothetical protein [Thiorhodovibrio frisius]|uniref:Uncharacterized protein n=1 Tax=Thiorhodovibrio frisius TaxID=631362 RepID=H8Z8R2_9GAMM|nr:hypothetical protein [Thiorhodovibrio frisius]EIC19467.1 hypothetical protein Thi970DRAFT_04991 [Thiorhodovibrio frisius]WPL22227.1 hypothetical protein Thiofri_02387 [Thiorhodovibrio frisius]